YLIDNDVIKGGEYQLPDGLRRLTEAGYKFKPGKVIEWLDCGNKEVTVHTNQRVLEYDKEKGKLIQSASATLTNSLVIEPCFIGDNVQINNAIVGPHVSIGANSKIENAIVKNSIIQANASVVNAVVENSMIGSFASYEASAQDLSIGDYTTIKG